MRSFFLKFLLVLALLFAQQGSVLHGIAHTLAEQSQDQSLPHDQQCELCAAYAQVGSAVGSSSIQFDLTASFAETHSNLAVALQSSTFAAFAARAPPYSA
ncbi:MAG: hypothetical protein KJ795_12975 [Gammaproteobacteria bacterium]|nr:hypothetical protein [Gammaproteobacteria bacterium]MBU1776451.1 hypothetical protein [Gammaproteobacteria bacterium]MBU1968290.1 hypothetical protein [Gammaproteobacteria bacterium]